MRLAYLLLTVVLCLLSGCGNGRADEEAELRKEVRQLRQEVDALKVRVAESGRAERRSSFGGSAARYRATSETPSRLSPEEMKARHEAMRDPEKREQLRAEYRARMEAQKKRMEERRRLYEERRSRRQADDVSAAAISDSEQK